MTKGFKIFLIVCAALVIVGMVFAGIGFIMGGTGNITLDRYFNHIGFISEDGGTFSGDIVEMESELDSFTNVDIQVAITNVKFIESDSYRVEYSYDKGFGAPSVSVKDHTLRIYDKTYQQGFSLNRFGINLPKNTKGFYLNIYYPAGVDFGTIDIQSDMGDVKLSDINTNSLDINLDLGDVAIENVKANRANFNLDLGELTASNFESNGLTAELDLGSAKISGHLAGDIDISCDLGDIKITTDIPKSDYNYDVEVDLGNFKLDGSKQGSPYESSNGAANSFELNCSLGNISIDFQ